MEEIEGYHIVKFTNGDVQAINVKQNIITSQAHPIYLIDVHGEIFNWQNIISVKKRGNG